MIYKYKIMFIMDERRTTYQLSFQVKSKCTISYCSLIMMPFVSIFILAKTGFHRSLNVGQLPIYFCLYGRFLEIEKNEYLNTFEYSNNSQRIYSDLKIFGL